MPTANWLNPQPASYTSEPEPRGLLSFLGGGPDLGADISDRLGIISQILMAAGSGRGGAGIAEATAAANERSDARRERRKAERMVNRAADKIEGSNPEMAALMRANTAFGMQMLGKQYESDWSSKARLAEIEKEYQLRGDLDARKLAAQQAADEASWAQFSGGEDTGSDSAAQPPVPAQPAAEPMPGDTQAPSYDMAGLLPRPPNQSVTPNGMDIATGTQAIPDGMSAGTGTEPAPSQVPQQPPVPQQPAFDPMLAQPPMPEISKNPTVAKWQKNLSRSMGVPVSEGDIRVLYAAHKKGGVDFATAMSNIQTNWRSQQKVYQDRAIEEQHRLEDQVNKQAEVDAANAYKEGEPGRFQKQYEQTIPKLPPTVSRIPLDKLAVLRKEGLSDQDIEQLGGADLVYNQIMTGVRGGPGTQATATADIRDDLLKSRTAQDEAGRAAKAGLIVQEQVEAMKDTIRPDPTGQYSGQQEQMLAQLESIKAGKPEDAAANMAKFREIYAKELETAGTQDLARQKFELDKRAADAAERKAKDEQNKALAATDSAEYAVLSRAFSAEDSLKRVIKMIEDPGNREVIHGPGGWIESFDPGSTRSRIETYVSNLESILATDYIQGMKKQSATGATGLGNTNQEEIQLAKTLVANLKDALKNGTDTEYALKTVHNYFNNMIMPDGGQRFDTEKPGFKLEDFNMEKHNPALFIQQQRKKTIVDESGVTIRPNQ